MDKKESNGSNEENQNKENINNEGLQRQLNVDANLNDVIIN